MTAGAGPDVALLHGWGMHGGLFKDLAAGLEPDFRVHVLDLPGHGRSAFGKGDQDLEGIARRVAEHIPERCSLLGWSLGGLVAARIARLFPARVPRLVLVASSPRFLKGRDWPHGGEEKTLTALAAGLKRDWRGTINDFLGLQVRGDEHQLETLRALKSTVFANGEPGLQALAAGLEVLRTTDLRPELALIRARTLVIGGAYDRLAAPGAIEALAAGIPGARAVIVPRAAHAPFLSHPAAFLGLVTEFLSSP